MSVFFAELSGPAGIGRDPEDVRHVIGGALAAVIAEVESLGGTVTSVSGAGLVAIFGAPQAHEDDPERAVRTGSRALSAIGAVGAPSLSVRVGIETGPTVVGPMGPVPVTVRWARWWGWPPPCSRRPRRVRSS